MRGETLILVALVVIWFGYFLPRLAQRGASGEMAAAATAAAQPKPRLTAVQRRLRVLLFLFVANCFSLGVMLAGWVGYLSVIVSFSLLGGYFLALVWCGHRRATSRSNASRGRGGTAPPMTAGDEAGDRAWDGSVREVAQAQDEQEAPEPAVIVAASSEPAGDASDEAPDSHTVQGDIFDVEVVNRLEAVQRRLGDDVTWAPVTIPPPVYTLKASATAAYGPPATAVSAKAEPPHRILAPIPGPEVPQLDLPLPAHRGNVSVEAAETAETAEKAPQPAVSQRLWESRRTSWADNLDMVLARRRTVGG